jgi:hypothetical protein
VSGAVFIVALLKAEAKDVPQIVETIVGSKDVALIGWIVAAIILVVAVVFLKILCVLYDREIERLVTERDQLQRYLMQNPEIKK